MRRRPAPAPTSPTPSKRPKTVVVPDSENEDGECITWTSDFGSTHLPVSNALVEQRTATHEHLGAPQTVAAPRGQSPNVSCRGAGPETERQESALSTHSPVTGRIELRGSASNMRMGAGIRATDPSPESVSERSVASAQSSSATLAQTQQGNSERSASAPSYLSRQPTAKAKATSVGAGPSGIPLAASDSPQVGSSSAERPRGLRAQQRRSYVVRPDIGEAGSEHDADEDSESRSEDSVGESSSEDSAGESSAEDSDTGESESDDHVSDIDRDSPFEGFELAGSEDIVADRSNISALSPVTDVDDEGYDSDVYRAGLVDDVPVVQGKDKVEGKAKGKARAKPRFVDDDDSESALTWEKAVRNVHVQRRRDLPDSLSPPSEADWSSRLSVSATSPVHVLIEDWRKIFNVLWADYESALPAYKNKYGNAYDFWACRTLEAPRQTAWYPMFLRGIWDLASSKEEVFEEVLRGFSFETLESLADREHTDYETFARRMGGKLSDTETGNWPGVYLLLPRGGGYVGSSKVSVRERVRNHWRDIKFVPAWRENPTKYKKPQAVHFRVAEHYHLDTRVLAQYGDETPVAIILLCECLMMCYFGTQADYGAFWEGQGGEEGLALSQQARQRSTWELKGHHLNFSFPTHETIHWKKRDPSRVACEYCGDSQVLQREHGYQITKMTHAFNPKKKTTCQLCYSRMVFYGDVDTFYRRPWYVRNALGMPAAKCRNCGDDDPTQLSTVADHNQDWAQAFLCLDCNSYRKHKGHPARPQYIWKPHLRPELQCQSCGAQEHSDPTVVMHIIGGRGPRRNLAMCAACYGPDPGNLQGVEGWTQKSAQAHRRELANRTWNYGQYVVGSRAAPPPPPYAFPGWDHRDRAKYNNKLRQSTKRLNDSYRANPTSESAQRRIGVQKRGKEKRRAREAVLRESRKAAKTGASKAQS